MDSYGQGEWQRLFPWRFVAVAVPPGMALLALIESFAIDGAGVRLCGWPATMTCEHGLPVAWPLLRWMLWGFVVVAAVDVAFFLGEPTRQAANRILWWAGWGPMTLLITVHAASDSALDRRDLVLGAVVLLVALVLTGRTLVARLDMPERLVAIVLAPLILVAVTAPLWVPPAFVAVRDAEPTRDESFRGVREGAP